jgi:YidC/Oxa1 family membrane protein insertase
VDNRRLLFAALLSMGVLFLWQVLFPPPEPARGPAAPEPLAVETPTPETVAAPVAESAAGAVGAPDAAATAPTGLPLASDLELTSVLENELVRAEFTNRGAQLVSFQVLSKTGRDGGPLELVQPRNATPFPFALLGADGAPHGLNAGLFVSERGSSEVRFDYRGASGAASKRFALLDDGRLEFEFEIGGGAAPWRVLIGPGLRARSIDELDNRFDQRGAVWLTAGEVERHDSKADDGLRLPGSALDWVGLEDTYFLSVVMPGAGLAEARIQPVSMEASGEDEVTFEGRPILPGAELSEAEGNRPRALQLELVPNGERLEGVSYWGAKQYDRLSALGLGLEQTVRWGWLGVIAKPLLRSLQWIQAHLASNYGWAIVLLTTALKIVLLPLSLASFKSMRKMQKLNPKMQAIRERFRPKLRDKQGRFKPEMQRQMNEEIMALYRQEGVNPAGGCLPMLVQLPIFFGFYTLLRTAVELWHAPWIGWIHDLSEPDPYYVLPIVMGISQIAMQKMTPSPPDAVQKRLMQAMPIVFTIFSLGFASGLVLYWMTNNVLSIGQQALYNSIRERAEHEEQAAGGKAKGGAKPAGPGGGKRSKKKS